MYAFAEERMGHIPRGRRIPVIVARAVRGGPGPHRCTGLRRLFAIGGDLSPRQAQGRCHVCCAEPAADSGRRALHSPDGRDVISSQTRRATGGAHRERWRDRPCETAATGEAYRQASWQVPTPAEETPRDESKDVSDEASLHRASAKQERRGLLLSLNLRELFEDRIPLRTSQSRGWRTRGYPLWACRCSRTRPS
jgi:hypothetical protein